MSQDPGCNNIGPSYVGLALGYAYLFQVILLKNTLDMLYNDQLLRKQTCNPKKKTPHPIV